MNSWSGHPDIVSKGAQKNFAHFADGIGKEWAKQSENFNETFFRHSVAKAIAFHATEKLVTEQPWYQGGFRANIVTYAIAKLAFDAGLRGLAVDFDAIWRRQALSDTMLRALAIAAFEAQKVITSPLPGISNVTEWAKQQACWAIVRDVEIAWPTDWLDELMGKDEARAQKKSAVKDQRLLDGIGAQTLVVQAGPGVWTELLKWGQARDLLSPNEAGILKTAAAIPMKVPSELQSQRVIEILRKMHREGCQLGRDLHL